MIDWISREVRVPDDRRKVLACGYRRIIGIINKKVCCITRFNIKEGDGGEFDGEGLDFLGHVRITHWSDINFPEDSSDVDPG